MKKIKSTTGETIKFRPDVKVISITPEGVVVDEATSIIISDRLGSQVEIEDTDEVVVPEGVESTPDAEVKSEDAPADVGTGDPTPDDVIPE